MSVKLRAFQSDVMDGIDAAWGGGARDVMGVMPCGSGKSVLAAHALSRDPLAGVFIAHRSELISGESLALARNGVRHRVIGPESLRRECSRRHVAEGLWDHVDRNSRTAIASVDTLIGLPAHDPWLRSVQLAVTDECFPAGTLVDGRPIETIQVGDMVTAFDEATGTFHKRRVTKTFKNPIHEIMVRVKWYAADGELVCTGNHPILTQRGWVDAGKLSLHDDVAVLDAGGICWDSICHLSDYVTPNNELDGYVYNLEVEEFHTYVANGIVVHNCHHLLRDNKWGRALDLFPNAKGLGLTATPIRADGKGLGRWADGVFDIMVEGPSARQIELWGFLTPHVIYAPPSDLDLSSVPIGPSGDLVQKKLVAATRASHIVGDVVQHYRRFADGLLGMTFTVDVQGAIDIAAAFRSAGIPAEVVSGKTPGDVRNAIFRRFRNGEIRQLVSCDIAGEGFDLPDVAAISLARATESYGLATQQIGRVKRILAGKERGIVIDHVHNVARHCQAKLCGQTGEWYIAVGEREWSLDRRDRRSSGKKPEIAITTCPECLRSYERVLGRTCPYCSYTTQPTNRSAPEFVDGVLSELDPAAMARMQGDIARIDGAPVIPFGASPIVSRAVTNRHHERREAVDGLRQSIALWAGWYGRSVDEAQRAFWLTYGVDVGTAQTFGRPEAEALKERIDRDLVARGVVSAERNPT